MGNDNEMEYVMITDRERRRVAQNLRNSRYRLKPVPSGKQVMSMTRAASELELAHEGNYLNQSGFERLADLIDRPTCHDVLGEKAYSDYFKCSECGFAINTWDMDGAWLTIYYCPNCGAEVVETELLSRE